MLILNRIYNSKCIVICILKRGWCTVPYLFLFFFYILHLISNLNYYLKLPNELGAFHLKFIFLYLKSRLMLISNPFLNATHLSNTVEFSTESVYGLIIDKYMYGTSLLPIGQSVVLKCM